MLYGLDDRPPWPTSVLAGIQHLLAVFGGIVTAPLIIAVGMGLPTAETNYLVTSALLVSGLATALQISRIGPLGSGLLAIQGTSFTFIGPILFAYAQLPQDYGPAERLAVIFGCCGAASLCMLFFASTLLLRLHRLFTPTVTGATVFLLGSTLVWGTLQNLLGLWRAASGTAALQVLFLAALVFAVTLFVATRRNPWLRLSSIMLGLLTGYLLAMLLGAVNFSVLGELPLTFLPDPLRYGLGFDWPVFFILLPIFLVSATESIGDLTATSALSGLPGSGPAYWGRVRGGVIGDALNSLFAAFFATFPNTTFSQNNGVIQLTGIASRKVGFVVAALLVLLGFFPLIGGVIQAVPPAVLFGSTLLMFVFVTLSGLGILRRGGAGCREWAIAVASVVGGWVLAGLVGEFRSLPEALRMTLQFPVSTGAFLAMILELLVPRSFLRRAVA